MKKFLKVLLSFVMCLSLCACDSKKESIRLHYVNREECLLICSSEEELKSRIKKIEITKDNWDKYFSDYNNFNYNEVTDESGNKKVENTFIFGFGLKYSVLGYYNKVSFKFDEIRQFESEVITGKELKDVSYTVLTANSNIHKVCNYKGGSCVTLEVPLSEVEEYYTITLENSESIASLQVDKVKCLDASGTLYVIEIPELYYHGENVTSIRFENAGTVTMNLDYIKQLYEK